MIQILAVLAGIAAIYTGGFAIAKKKIALTSKQPLTGTAAVITGSIAIAAGIGIILFAVIGIPMLLR